MINLMEDIEDASCFLSKCASTVVGETNVKKKTKWVGEVDIGIIAKICATPKSMDGVRVSEQERKLQCECAEFIASKLLELIGFDTDGVARTWK